MRKVHSGDGRWLTPGIASTHVDALLGCNESGLTPLKLWADRVSIRRKAAMRKDKSLDQGSANWLDWRGRGVGGSEVAAICGETQYGSPHGVWKAKMAAKLGDADGGVENEHMARGKRLEPVARSRYEGLMGFQCPPVCVLHDDFDFVRASLDGLREPGDDVVLEIKAPTPRNHAKALRVRDEPSLFRSLIPHYFCQVQYQLLITKSPVAHFVSYSEDAQFGPDRFALVEVPADENYQEFVLEAVRQFWQYVESETPPPGA